MKKFSPLLWLGLLAASTPLTAQDCLPSVTVFNGITTNLIPTDSDANGQTDLLSATVKAADLVRMSLSPCGSGALEYRIRKSGFGAGTPTTTEVSFDCTELGTQQLEVWVGDAQGNWNYVNTYVIVQNPTGDCGDDPLQTTTDCVDDKIPPTLLLLNGVAASFLPDSEGSGSVTISPNNLAFHREDNCGGPVKLRIRRAGTGAGVPLSKSVTFTCDEQGLQLVEVWAGDGADNWIYSETYVLLKDENGDCDNAVAAGCTPDLTPPDVLVHNGLAVSMAPGAVDPAAVVRAKPFLRQRRDNCDGPLVIRIGRDDGNPTPPTTTSLNFGCDELGTQPVVIWVSDAAGNWSRTPTYVLVQDNVGLCDGLRAVDANAAMPSWKLPAQTAMRGRSSMAAGALHVAVQPNPTNGSFAVTGQTEQAGSARCELFNAVGQKVATLTDLGWLPAGEFRLDLQTGDVPTGIYWCVLQVSGSTITLPLVRE